MAIEMMMPAGEARQKNLNSRVKANPNSL